VELIFFQKITDAPLLDNISSGRLST